MARDAVAVVGTLLNRKVVCEVDGNLANVVPRPPLLYRGFVPLQPRIACLCTLQQLPRSNQDRGATFRGASKVWGLL